MRRIRAGLFAALLLMGSVVAVMSNANAGEPAVELRPALSKERITGFGTVTPPRDGATARLTLLRREGDAWQRLASQSVALRGSRDSNGDGRRDSRFSGSFPSPDEGTCKLRLRVRGNDRFDPTKTSVELPCTRPDFPTGTARLVSGTDRKDIAVEIADTNSLRAFGLMYKRRLGAERGMAFQFDSDPGGGFWMKNTLIPLSIAFYELDGTIVRILDMEPCYPDPPEGCPVYDPNATYRGALEVNQGAFDEWGISEGDRIVVTAD